MSTRLFYIDDSGAEETRWVVYSWIECAAQDWRKGLRTWLDLRKQLHARYSIEPSYELHAVKFIPGRGNPSTDPAWNRQKHLRSAVVEEALTAIGQCGHLGVGTVYRQTGAGGSKYAQARADVYLELVKHLEQRLASADEMGIIFIDGDGTDPSYRRAHRGLKLGQRHIIEDPLFHKSHESQWIQMADFAAYTAYQGLQQHSGKKYAWSWYNDYLGQCDVNGSPLEV